MYRAAVHHPDEVVAIGVDRAGIVEVVERMLAERDGHRGSALHLFQPPEPDHATGPHLARQWLEHLLDRLARYRACWAEG